MMIIISVLLCSFQTRAIEVAAERGDHYLPMLEDKRVGLVVNQSARVGEQHLLDYLTDNQVNVVRIFAPEHGFRGNKGAGVYINDDKDVKTGVSIVSLYGANKKPKPEQLADIDILVFDIQDVGVRFYTYLSTLVLTMEAAQQKGISYLVLDRPNPNITYVDGPVLEQRFRSFVGMLPVPILHGMTLGELALMSVGEGWLTSTGQLDLTVIPVASYSAKDDYALPIAPSPNLPNQRAIYLYPSLCLFEATQVSVGRGSDFPFQVFGHDRVRLGTFAFSPRSIPGAAMHPKLQGKTVYGKDLRHSGQRGLSLDWLVQTQSAFVQQQQVMINSPDFFDKLAGADVIRLALAQGLKAHQIEAIWQQEVQAFKTRRLPYLLYERE
ncbi:DUF1343 domain-containing protein [Pseudoalteromonas sp. OOF1S-7]|uniref:exo-beta-N-acetylmuramidase NamZ family protein n=1 Tax=Pseudoalteromonas sp. OOF1S-7 TaxID=2917757 RepID=UPI001EF4C768|nr:DUF1343 domain-containing protein [Pseudoalteromonas sp. OOF1S-7]MCG7534669.1 DUF1343 domain-containing protein [Pseudoalteromonas sp. OOF1S-7]